MQRGLLLRGAAHRIIDDCVLDHPLHIALGLGEGDRLDPLEYVDPARQEARDQVRFGATVELADEEDNRRTVTLVGNDEADASSGRIGWSAPLARALIGAKVGDERIVRLPAGEKSYEVMRIDYPAA